MSRLCVTTITSLLAAAVPNGCSDDSAFSNPGGADFSRLNVITELAGGNEVPPVATTAGGTARFTTGGIALLLRIDVESITNVTAAHIHGPADAGMSAGVLVNLYASAPGERFTGTGTLESGVTSAPRVGVDFDSLLVQMRQGLAYVNVHTERNPGGEIRGQIVLEDPNAA